MRVVRAAKRSLTRRMGKMPAQRRADGAFACELFDEAALDALRQAVLAQIAAEYRRVGEDFAQLSAIAFRPADLDALQLFLSMRAQ